MGILITLPDFDPTTKYISEWNKSIIVPAMLRNCRDNHILEKQKANRSHVKYTIEKENPRLLIFNGHGDDDCICGHNNEILIKLGENDNLLDSRIVHSFTCSSAGQLGVKSKADAFVGFDDKFLFWMHRSSETKPLRDPLATPQIKSAITVPFEIVKGRSVNEAYDISQTAYASLIKEYTWNSSKYTTEEIQRVLPFLIWNKMHQKMIGNGNAKL